MPKILAFFFLFAITFIFSCKSSSNKFDEEEKNAAVILKNYDSFWKYWSDSIKLSENYFPLDDSSKPISKQSFLNQLSYGYYLPMRQIIRDTLFYKLHRINTPNHGGISQTISTMAIHENRNFQLEGKPLPNFNFTDLNKIHYSNENTKGKILAIKLWFIHCVACNKEIPDCNKLVAENANRKDVLFLSLANDQKKELQDFLAKTDFKYAIIPNQLDYVRNDLGIGIWPTHIIVNKKGNVVKVMQSFEEMKNVLSRELLK